jgi:hypothetical protein
VLPKRNVSGTRSSGKRSRARPRNARSGRCDRSGGGVPRCGRSGYVGLTTPEFARRAAPLVEDQPDRARLTNALTCRCPRAAYRPVEWSARGGEHSEPAGTASCSRRDVPAPDPVLVDDVIAAEDRPMLLGWRTQRKGPFPAFRYPSSIVCPHRGHTSSDSWNHSLAAWPFMGDLFLDRRVGTGSQVGLVSR